MIQTSLGKIGEGGKKERAPRWGQRHSYCRYLGLHREMPSNVRRELHMPHALTLTLALLCYPLKLLTLTPRKAWSCGESKGGRVLNRKGCDALASQSCCVPLDHSF